MRQKAGHVANAATASGIHAGTTGVARKATPPLDLGAHG
jgi:hypothetical protein